MKATVSPLFALKEIFSNIYSSASGYLNDTFLNSTVPVSFKSLISEILPSLIVISSSNTSLFLNTL